MSVNNQIHQLEQDGFCVLPNIIPTNCISAICQEIVDVQKTNHAQAEAEKNKTRTRGHRIGSPGVSNLRQIINYTQCFAPYLAAPPIMGLLGALFGPYARISCTDCVINHPGNERNYWHADWPYNQTNASHIPAPYPDTLLHLSSIWMLTPFSIENGGTLIVPGSHRQSENPSTGKLDWMDYEAPYPTEINVTGTAGSVLFYDSRLWHAVAPNHSKQDRVALIIRFAPWWLNLNPTIIGYPEHTMMVAETGGKNYEAPPLPPAVYNSLPEEVKPLYRHAVS